jgi:hypothetical protein
LNLSSDSPDAALGNKIEGRKNRVVLGYKLMTAAYLAAGLLAAKASGATTSLLRVLGGYIALPAGLSYILISAAANDRLGSDTYKRLNLAMLEYSALGSLVVLLGKGRNKILALAFVLSLINCVKGYTYGVLGWNKQNDASLIKDVVQGTKDTINGFFTAPKSITSLGYLIATTMVASFKVEKLTEVVKFISMNSIFAEGLAMPLAQFNRLALITLSLYTLKDAADRNRLGGTTFIELNYLCSLSLGIHGAFYTGGIRTPFGALSALFAVFCGFVGLKEFTKKG